VNTLLDRRIAARRHAVAEHGARRRLRRLMFVLLVVALVAGAIWLLTSPLMAVDSIALHGAVHSDAAAILTDAGVESGVPTVSVRASSVEEALRTDPWIVDADVSVTWPGTVEVVVLEHEPAAWVAAGSGWMLVAATGDILQRANAPAAGEPTIELIGTPPGRPGTVVDDEAARGAALFVASLPVGLRASVTVTGSEGALWARAGGHEVRLGRAVDMGEKAAALGAILETDLDPEAVIDLISPRWPAIRNPEAEVEGEGEGLAQPQPEN
jgi:cell division protein FtsQ